MHGPPAITVVAPLYRCGATVEELHRRLCRVLEAEAGGHEILFVDDACPEGSGEKARALAAHDPRVGVLTLARNVGQHRAVLRGLAHAAGEWTVVLDADLQDPPEAIPMLLQVARGGYDAVFAGRRGAYESALRRASSRAFKRVLWACCRIPADAGLFVVLSRRLAEALARSPVRRPFVEVLIARTGLPVTSVPVTRQPRADGRSAYTSAGRWRLAADALRLALARGGHRDALPLEPAEFTAPASRTSATLAPGHP